MRSFGLLARHTKFLKTGVVYNALVFFSFLIVYAFLDFNKHFVSAQRVTMKGKLYYAMMHHTAAGSGDIVPATDTARIITGLHVWLAWMQLVLVFLA